MYLGIKAIISKSFARIHRDNLINCGILPLMFADKRNFDKIKLNDILDLKNVRDSLNKAEKILTIKNLTQELEFNVENDLSDREREILLAGGKLNYTQQLKL